MTQTHWLAPIGGVLLLGGLASWLGAPSWVIVGIGAGLATYGLTRPRRVFEEAPRAPVPVPVPREANEDRAIELAGVEYAGVAILVLDGQSRVSACNAAGRALVAPGGRRVLGRPIDEVVTTRSILSVCEACVGTGRATRGEIEWITPDGPRVHAASAAALPGGGVVLTLHDITESANAALSRSDFAANASHEIRTPVAAIKLAIETMTGEAAGDAAMQSRLVSMIAGNVSRLEEVLNDVLDLSRAESSNAPIEAHPIDIREFARSVAEPFEAPASERGLRIVVEVSAGLEAFWSDARLLRLILRNLVENSVKFAHDGTEVRVSVSRIAGGARFEVADQGVGIPLEDQPRIFERYFRVDRARTGSPGTGLGLAIAKHAVERLRGTIRVSSVWKQGTTMTVEIPEAEVEGAS